MNEILLKSIKEITIFTKEEKQEFLKVMNKLSDEKREEKYQGDKEKLEKLSSRNEELTILITKLYEYHAFGKIPIKHFDRLFNVYDTEQQNLEKQIQYFEQEIESCHKRKVDTDKFLKMIEKYTDIEELTVPMINEYIEKVIVHEAIGGRKEKDRKQQVDVYFNFIGNIQLNKNEKKLENTN
ncbi:Site-specific recombinase [Clostridiaceae bacterium JG1575]|nr:Site-specific recombinase [Clostridiaceae bacterium JG1575]